MSLSDRTTLAVQCLLPVAAMSNPRPSNSDLVDDCFTIADEFLKHERDYRITKRRIETLEHALAQCRERFEEYANLHAAKPDPQKEARNRAMVEMIDAALRSEP